MILSLALTTSFVLGIATIAHQRHFFRQSWIISISAGIAAPVAAAIIAIRICLLPVTALVMLGGHVIHFFRTIIDSAQLAINALSA